MPDTKMGKKWYKKQMVHFLLFHLTNKVDFFSPTDLEHELALDRPETGEFTCDIFALWVKCTLHVYCVAAALLNCCCVHTGSSAAAEQLLPYFNNEFAFDNYQ